MKDFFKNDPFTPLSRWWGNFKRRLQVVLRNLNIKILDFLYHHNLGVSYYESVYVKNEDLTSPQRQPDMETDRFKFVVTYIHRWTIGVDERWYYSTRSGKRLLILSDYHQEAHRLDYRAELKSFYAHFSPRERMWVHSNDPAVCFVHEFTGFDKPTGDFIDRPVEFKTHRCDFSQCRFAFSISFDKTHGLTPEVLSQSYKDLKRDLTSKVPEINKILTGADYDGEMMSPKKKPLCDNLVCRQCGLPVFATDDRYHFDCLVHGEIAYARVNRVDPVTYQVILRNTTEILEDLIRKKCPQD